MLRLRPVFKKSLGQSLIEVVVLIGLALVIVTGLTIVTINGLKNSQFSQNQAQASRLAQEAIDCVRSIRDKNLPVTIAGTAYYWYDQDTYPNQIWGLTVTPTPTKFSIVTGGGGNCAGLISTPGNDTSLNGTPFSPTFTRTITITDDNNLNPSANFKRVESNVSWVDISGTHQSKITTILSLY